MPTVWDTKKVIMKKLAFIYAFIVEVHFSLGWFCKIFESLWLHWHHFSLKWCGMVITLRLSPKRPSRSRASGSQPSQPHGCLREPWDPCLQDSFRIREALEWLQPSQAIGNSSGNIHPHQKHGYIYIYLQAGKSPVIYKKIFWMYQLFHRKIYPESSFLLDLYF